MKEGKTLYFDKPGPQNTTAVLEAIRDWIPQVQPAAVIVTTTTGKTALEAARILKDTGARLIGAQFQKHVAEERDWHLDPELAAQCKEAGVEFLPDEPALELLDKERGDIVNAWRCLGQGFKVAVQVASMCVDTGLIPAGATVIAAGGSAKGADVAIVVKPFGAADIFKSKVNEIIALPIK
jgi:uncharacterized protein